MKKTLPGIKLGEKQEYVDEYDPSLLQPIPRSLSRAQLLNSEFFGVDVWTAYELSWLDITGKPLVAIAEFFVPASSPNIIESKSFKYYLNSLNQARFSDVDELKEVLEKDLAWAAGQAVIVKIYSLMDFYRQRQNAQDLGFCLDDLSISEVSNLPSSNMLKLTALGEGGQVSKITWCSHLLKSNCPVTGQPDWASIWIGLVGKSLCPQSLLSYIVAYRKHQDFHENCVESIFSDLRGVCEPEELWVYARYTRRGGLDINPFRSLVPMDPPMLVGVRQ